MIALAISAALLTQVLRAHQEAPHPAPCTHEEIAYGLPGCDCEPQSRAIVADLATHHVFARVLHLISAADPRHGHAVALVDERTMLDPEQPWPVPRGRYAPLWIEAEPGQ
jgi:hypothetical protein